MLVNKLWKRIKYKKDEYKKERRILLYLKRIKDKEMKKREE